MSTSKNTVSGLERGEPSVETDRQRWQRHIQEASMPIVDAADHDRVPTLAENRSNPVQQYWMLKERYEEFMHFRGKPRCFDELVRTAQGAETAAQCANTFRDRAAEILCEMKVRGILKPGCSPIGSEEVSENLQELSVSEFLAREPPWRELNAEQMQRLKEAMRRACATFKPREPVVLADMARERDSAARNGSLLEVGDQPDGEEDDR